MHIIRFSVIKVSYTVEDQISCVRLLCFVCIPDIRTYACTYYIHTYGHLYICAYITYVHMYLHPFALIHTGTCTYVYMCIHTCICMSKNTYVCLHVYTYAQVFANNFLLDGCLHDF